MHVEHVGKLTLCEAIKQVLTHIMKKALFGNLKTHAFKELKDQREILHLRYDYLCGLFC